MPSDAMKPEMIEKQVGEAFRQFCIHDWNKPSWWGSEDTDRFVTRLAKHLTAALAQGAVEAKPVAWRWRWTEGSEINQRWHLCWELPKLGDGGHIAEPLVPAASPPEELSRVTRELDDVRQAADALLHNLWGSVVSGVRTHEENWKEYERRYPGVKRLHDALRAGAATAEARAQLAALSREGGR